MTTQDLDVLVSCYEGVLSVRFPGPERPLHHAIRGIYATKSATAMVFCARSLLPQGSENIAAPLRSMNQADRGHPVEERALAGNEPSEKAEPDGPLALGRKLPLIGSSSRARLALPRSDVVRSAVPRLLQAVAVKDAVTATEVLGEMAGFALSPIPEQFDRLETSVGAVTGRDRLIPMVELAVLATELGVLDRAAAYVREVLANDPGPLELHDLHTVEGILALAEDRIEKARQSLFASVHVCQDLGRFVIGRGPVPNLMLAKRLLQLGDEAQVIEYLTRCQRPWRHCANAIAQWIGAIQQDSRTAAEPDRLNMIIGRAMVAKMVALVSVERIPGLTADLFDEIIAERKRQQDAAVKGKLETGQN